MLDSVSVYYVGSSEESIAASAFILQGTRLDSFNRLTRSVFLRWKRRTMSSIGTGVSFWGKQLGGAGLMRFMLLGF